MAKTKRQFLVNYHTSDATNMPLATDVKKGEIVVRHSDEKPELLILTDNGEFATFIDKNAVSGMLVTEVTRLDNAITTVDSKFDGYATSADTVAAIKTVNDRFASYATSAETVAAIEAVDGKFVQYAKSADTAVAVAGLNGRIDALESTLEETYATSADTVAAIKAVDDKLVNYALSADTAAAIKAVQTDVDALEEAVQLLQGYSANTAVQTIVVSGITGVEVEKTETQYTIDFTEMVIDGGEF